MGSVATASTRHDGDSIKTTIWVLIWAFMTSMGVSSFMLPAKRKSKASKTCKLHRAEERMIWLRVKGWRWVCWMLSDVEYLI